MLKNANVAGVLSYKAIGNTNGVACSHACRSPFVVPVKKQGEKTLGIGTLTMDFQVDIALLAAKLRERQRWADAITDATIAVDAPQFNAADDAVNDQFDYMAARYGMQEEGR